MGAMDRLKRAGFLATVASGAGLLAASVSGITSVDADLQAAVDERRTQFVTDGGPPGPGGHGDCPRLREERLSY